MDVIGIPCLNWNDYLGDETVGAAYEHLKRLTRRTIALHSMALVPDFHNPCSCGWRDAFHVFVDETSPTLRYSLAHELLHGILIEENYCKVAGRFPREFNIQEILSNDMQHPEIFRRMEMYGPEMSPYWDHWDELLGDEVMALQRVAPNPIDGFWQFPRVFTWFFFQQVSGPHLEAYREYDSALYKAAEAAYDDTKASGFRNAECQRKTIGIFKSHWLRNCSDRLPKYGMGQTLLNCMQESTVTPMIDFEKVRPAEDILRLLMTRGFRKQ